MAEHAKAVPEPVIKEGASIILDSAATPVALDNGYADHKICYWAGDGRGGRRIARAAYPARACMGVANINVAGGEDGVYHLDGDPWTVSPTLRDPDRMRGKAYATSDLNAVLVHHSLLRAGFGGVSVRLATGVPISHFYAANRPDTTFVSAIRSSLKVELEAPGQAPLAAIDKHDVYPESVAAAIDWMLDDQGNAREAPSLGIAVCDIGGNTTDVSIIDGDFNIDAGRSGSREQLGVLNVRETFGDLVRDRFAVSSVRDSQLDDALRAGTISLFGRQEPVLDLISEARRLTGRRVLQYVGEMVGDGADLDVVLFVGGGAEVLSSVIQEYPNAVVPEEPAFANARGMLKQMEFLS